jgi:hypothetical protein
MAGRSTVGKEEEDASSTPKCGRAETQPLLVFPLNSNGARRPVARPALKLQGLPISRRQKQAE